MNFSLKKIALGLSYLCLIHFGANCFSWEKTCLRKLKRKVFPGIEDTGFVTSQNAPRTTEMFSTMEYFDDEGGKQPTKPRNQPAEMVDEIGYEVAFDDEVKKYLKRRKSKVKFALFRCHEDICDREQVDDMKIRFKAAATSQVVLAWTSSPRSVLVLVKPDSQNFPAYVQAVRFLTEQRGLDVYAEKAFRDELDNQESIDVMVYEDDSPIDFAVTMGGDGLLMYANTLFRESVPPMLCFNMGSLGFLTPFMYTRLKDEVDRLLCGNIMLSLRMRLHCAIYDQGRIVEEYNCLNEVVIDRGSSPYLSNIECYCDNLHLTTVQADGIIIATPTGSTAYSMSAGGSIMHPSVPAILFTPICPHSLSFRPVIFPDSAVLRCDIPEDARHGASLSFDGKRSAVLGKGGSLEVKMSYFPVPTVCKNDHTRDWFSSLDKGLNFNQRQKQKPLDQKG